MKDLFYEFLVRMSRWTGPWFAAVPVTGKEPAT